MIRTIKSDLRKRIENAFPRPVHESDQALAINYSSTYADELRSELQKSMPPASLPRRSRPEIRPTASRGHPEGLKSYLEAAKPFGRRRPSDGSIHGGSSETEDIDDEDIDDEDNDNEDDNEELRIGEILETQDLDAW